MKTALSWDCWGDGLKALKLDPETKDLVLENGDFVMVEGPDEEAQAVWLAISTNKGEWFLDTLHGLAYKYVQTKNPNEVQIKAEVMGTIYQDDRVAEVVEVNLEFDRQKRSLKIIFRAKMKSGATVTGEVNA